MGKKVKYLKIFHEVLFVKVTQNPNNRTMQDEIADSLNLKFDKNSETGRARIIFSTIESMNGPILVILDDVRAKFDPEDVGIPCNTNRCKILLTTCYKQDCDLMYCQRDIQLGPLSTEESWILFQKHSGIHDDEEYSRFDLLNVAHEVAFECEGREYKNGNQLWLKYLICPERLIKPGTNMNLFKKIVEDANHIKSHLQIRSI
ncbi:hypothetical protein P8452_44755 [Trifolium repens]|nr:hypothetical protein P8452_44755 [Trifolium repens]